MIQCWSTLNLDQQFRAINLNIVKYNNVTVRSLKSYVILKLGASSTPYQQPAHNSHKNSYIDETIQRHDKN